MDTDHIATGLLLASFAFLCVSIGYLVKSQSRMLEIQSRLLMAQTELAEWMAPQGNVSHQLMAANNWRDLPMEGRAVFRKALQEILTDMDREMN